MSYGDLINKGADLIDEKDDKFDPEVRKNYMNASEALGCIRKQWYSKNRPPVPQDWGFARRGRGVEAYVETCLQAAGVDLRLAGEDQEGVYSDKHRISATPDGVEARNYSLIGCEFKSIDPRTNRDKLPKKEHVAQLQIGMALVDLIKEDLGLPDLPFSHGVIVYTDASNWGDHVEHRVPFDPSILDDMKPRADKILNSKSVGRLPREGKSNGYECRSCPFKDECLSDPAAADAPYQAGRRGTRLAIAVQDYVAAKAEEGEVKSKLAAASERIKAEMTKKKADKVEVEGRLVSITTTAGRKTLDRKAVEAAGIDLSPFEKTGAASTRLTVK